MYYRVMANDTVWGAGTKQECERIVNMHKTVLNGHNKLTPISTYNFRIVEMEGDYPSKELMSLNIFYPTNVRIPKSGEFK